MIVPGRLQVCGPNQPEMRAAAAHAKTVRRRRALFHAAHVRRLRCEVGVCAAVAYVVVAF